MEAWGVKSITIKIAAFQYTVMKYKKESPTKRISSGILVEIRVFKRCLLLLHAFPSAQNIQHRLEADEESVGICY